MSLRHQVQSIVYVDSGSQDDSVIFARALNVETIVLDRTMPFSAARARNVGLDALLVREDLDYVQFVDGDCTVEVGWIDKASEKLDADLTIGLVTGWRTELDPRRNVFHAMCEVEWHRPSGDVTVCGGDMMVRVSAFRAAQGFNPRIIAAEDEEFCIRLSGMTGLRIYRLPCIMTRHDINMSSFQQWWKRHVRAGHGFAQVGSLHPAHFQRERRKVWFYGTVLPFTALMATGTGHWLFTSLPALIYGISWARTGRGLQKQGLTSRQAFHQAAYLVISKLPNLQGMLTFYLRSILSESPRLIEYK
jgi:cellulose synthase/poly-beta-1,6-N-acetylglucosamine synthase-like glycosyltransferase